jgi:hypothetical protein
MDTEPAGEVVIRGITTGGRVFRPSDWAERLAGIVSLVGADNRLNYSPNVRPEVQGGIRCVVINRRLEQLDARVYKFLMDFARDNDLEVVEGPKTPRV